MIHMGSDHRSVMARFVIKALNKGEPRKAQIDGRKRRRSEKTLMNEMRSTSAIMNLNVVSSKKQKPQQPHRSSKEMKPQKQRRTQKDVSKEKQQRQKHKLEPR